MSESADACCRSLIASCPSRATLETVADIAVGSKSGKIKGACAQYVGQALREWGKDTLAGCTGQVEAVIANAAVVRLNCCAMDGLCGLTLSMQYL